MSNENREQTTVVCVCVCMGLDVGASAKRSSVCGERAEVKWSVSSCSLSLSLSLLRLHITTSSALSETFKIPIRSWQQAFQAGFTFLCVSSVYFSNLVRGSWLWWWGGLQHKTPEDLRLRAFLCVCVCRCSCVSGPFSRGYPVRFPAPLCQTSSYRSCRWVVHCCVVPSPFTV